MTQSEQHFVGLTDLARMIEQHIVALGQLVDMAQLSYIEHLSGDEIARLDEWSAALDAWRPYARDMVCDHTPRVPAAPQSTKENEASEHGE